MAKWQVTVNYTWEGEADDEGDALLQADMAFSFWSDADAEEVEPDEEEETENDDDEESDASSS